ncbi:xylulokinase [Azospirillum sp. RWY-5-1]|uniref:Xylulose kinase n=1 Tax=Azospirillum oleiclasticum TaxID=2735135 RepID=A0ABX2TF15_9PROT|nr:xylulokinase [Azospirillum oleiclasticum]NYZ16054.1 xylulokinase [Azospirillum oleiclasticum]NYZ22935.1 xylulokinase [Azospirillum oleiclasticum]
MFLGIDLGTSGVKAVLVDGEQRVVGQATAPLTVHRPHPLWSEQDPADWWAATNAAVTALRDAHPAAMAGVRGVGLSGQMHGATLLDGRDRVLRPCILWNDGRSGAECAELEMLAPDLRAVTGNPAMPGFTAPKLLWVARHEPEIFAATRRVLLPKDWLRLRMTGEAVSEMSDSAGTLWLDVGRRAWSGAMLEATGLSEAHMPALVEGSDPGGTLLPEVAAAWGIAGRPVVAGGGGDNAAGAVGAGVVAPGTAFLSLGTSGVLFVSDDGFHPNPAQGVHAFCHALPGRWHRMSVILSAAASLTFAAAVTGAGGEAALLEEVEREDPDIGGLVFLPYLSGERTPHNDPQAKGVWFGMTHATTRAALGRAVLEGVAFALADGKEALEEAGTRFGTLRVIGGGARSALWGRILAAALDAPLAYPAAAEVGPAFGAARLARLAVTGEEPEAVCTPLPVSRVIEPDPELAAAMAHRRRLYRGLYGALKDSFAMAGEGLGT